MLGVRSAQRGLLEADHLYLDYVGRGSFYGFLASLRGQLFRDEEFAELYCPDNGRDSVPPSLVATALLLQAYDKVSDAEAKQRADFDIRWKVALGIEVEDRPFAKSTLQLFRAQLILHDRVRAVFQRSLQFARQTGYLKGRRMKVAVDTTYILGRGAVKDTYNLLADGIVQVVRALSDLDGTRPEEWALRHGLELYFGSSVKGEAEIDWDNQKERQALLQKIVADADLVLELARQVQGQFPEESPQRQGIVEAAELLGQLLLQDVERQEDGPALKDGVSRDRIPSVHDPEMRHGRKSSSKRFDGHKAAVVVDTDSQLVTAVDILPGNAGDNTGVLELVEQSEENTGIAVEETIGDAAYGDGGTRQAFADAGRTLIAKVPGRPNKACFPKEDFQIDLEAGTCTCPAGNVTHTLRTFGTRTNRLGRTYLARSFQFDPAVCGVCPLRSQCVAARYGAGRTVALHPQEALLQQALSSTQPRVDTPLTATLTDPDGVSGATTWAWHRSPDGTSAWAAITGAASASYTPVTTDVGRYLRATASYTDDADNAESLTSAATEAVAAADSLTASALGVPASHDGSTAFTFELRFSEEIVISYRDFSRSVFQITGGTVQKARRLAPPSNIGWEITVEPTGDGNVVITLPGSRACDVAGAICTSDGDRLYASISATVSGPAPVVPAPVATITPGTSPVAEGAAASFTVSLDGAAPVTLSVAVSVADTNGVLSGATPTSIAFAVGDESKTLILPIRDDNVIKTASTVTVSLVTGSGYTLGTTTSAEVSVTDNDIATWTVSTQSAEIDEGESSTITVAVANGKTFASNQTISLAVSGTAASSDYSLSATELTLRAGAGSATVTDDVILEGGETVTVTASHGGQSVGSATVTIEANDTPPSNDATLSSLALSGVDIGAFNSGTTGYSAIVGYDVSSTTVTADPNDDGASVTIADANGSTQGTSRAVSLSSGDNVIIVTIIAEDGTTTKVYTVTVTRAEPNVSWGQRLPDRDIPLGQSAKPTDLWSDGSKVWVITDWETGQVQIYSLADGALQSDLGFTLTGTVFPAALWSDGQTLWVADSSAGRVLAYLLSDGSRLPAQDFDQAVMSVAGNSRPSGLWSDGQTMWVADFSASKVFAYRLSDKARASAQEFDLASDQNGTPISPFGLWSDGETMLASDWQRGEIFAYTLSDRQRQPNRNIDTSESGTSYPSGIWSDGETLWVVDDLAKRIYAYAVPGLGSTP